MLRSFGAIITTAILITFLTPNSLAEKSPLLHPQVISFIKEAVTGKWHDAINQGIAIFVCSADRQAFLKPLSFQKSPVFVAKPRRWIHTLTKLAANKRVTTTTSLVDLNCPEVEELLHQANRHRLFKIPNRWILLNITQPEENAVVTTNPTNDNEDGAACRLLASGLPKTGDGFLGCTATDTDVILVCGTAGNTLALVDMWAATPLGFWRPVHDAGYFGEKRPACVRRYAVGLNRREIRVAFTILNNASVDHLDDGVDIQVDALTKFNWEVIQNVVKMLNGTFVKLLDQKFGYLINGSWNGIIGMMVRGEAELIGTSLAIVPNRYAVMKYANFPFPTKGVFIFRAPPMSYEHNLFLMPFPNSLWAATIGTVTVCAIMLYGVLKIEQSLGIAGEHAGEDRVAEAGKKRLKASGSDVALLAFGAICQQGSPLEARGVTGRIITLFLFIGILFMYTSYSASIVALLQSTSTDIKTYADFLHSKIALGAESEDYNKYYMLKLTEPVRQKIYEKKVKKNFMTLAEGIHRMRTSYFAFHTMPSIMYTEIENTFTENEKCGLIEIDNFLSLQAPQNAISNWSDNTELFLIALVFLSSVFGMQASYSCRILV